MPIRVTLDRMLALRGVKSRDLARYVGITEQNLSLLKSGKVKGVRFSTLERICDYLNCQPGDILAFEEVGEDGEGNDEIDRQRSSLEKIRPQ